MTREEAIRALERADGYVGIHYINGVEEAYINPHLREAVKVALSALRPVSREKVERWFGGQWEGSADGYADGELVYDMWTCSECGYVIDEEDDPNMLPDFCPKCGAANTEKAMEILKKRLEALKND